jgi:hypothetical protein
MHITSTHTLRTFFNSRKKEIPIKGLGDKKDEGVRKKSGKQRVSK